MSVETCRLCLDLGSKLLNVFENTMENNLPNKIEQCVSIQIKEEDKLPRTVCKNCIDQVLLWHKFKEKCLLSNKKLLENKDNWHDVADQTENLVTVKYECNEIKEENIILVIDDDNLSENDSDILEETFLNDEFIEETIKTENIYECEICPQKFDSFFDYLDHQPVHDGELVFKCNRCPESFLTRFDLVEHDRNHKIACPLCGLILLESSLKNHMIKHSDRFKCSFCPSKFSSKANLSEHIITVHSTIKNHICARCGKQFSTLSSLTIHIKSHSETRNYGCKYCDYAGKTASALYIHMTTHSRDTCICEICSKIFKSIRHLNDHLNKVHNPNKKHECSHCGKKFASKHKLIRHEGIHTGVRPYTCSVCSKSFMRSDALKEHMSTHEQREPRCCDLCGKKFSSRRGLTRHICAT